MVRAGKGATFVEDFLDNNFVGIGFESAGEVKSPVDKVVLITNMQMKNPNGKFMMAASQIQRFYDEFKVGDSVLTYDPGQRLYFIGKITFDVTTAEHELFRSRAVHWSGQIARDSLKQSTRNSLGAISTLFTVRDDAAADVLANAVNIGVEQSPAVEPIVDDSDREGAMVKTGV